MGCDWISGDKAGHAETKKVRLQTAHLGSQVDPLGWPMRGGKSGV